jgi:mono/diheme cytochrome c family protein
MENPTRHIQAIVVGLVLVLTVVILACNPNPPQNSKAAQAQRGEELYQKYCTECHGESADAALLASLKTAPPDLTKILERRNISDFPLQEIAQIIDGRREIAAHGDREMPVWGNDLKDKENLATDGELRGKLGELVAYLMSIQS